VDIELVLAVDISQSLDYDEHTLQRGGYVAAFRNPDVVAALTAGPLKRIAVTYMEWAGDFEPLQTVPWTIIDGTDSAAAFAVELQKAPIQGKQRTSISRALNTAALLIETNGIESMRKVIYLSGDGTNNAGLPVEPVRDELVKRGIVINGLPLMLGKPLEYYDFERMDLYFQRCVIGGQGSFVEPVRDLQQFSTLLASRLAAGPPAASATTLAMEAASVDCMTGEKAFAAPPSRDGFLNGLPLVTPP
jgi:hypothetical protein